MASFADTVKDIKEINYKHRFDVTKIGETPNESYRVSANSDNEVDLIHFLFPIGTIISTAHNNSQISNNKYTEYYYTIGDKGDLTAVVDGLTPEEITNGNDAIERMKNEYPDDENENGKRQRFGGAKRNKNSIKKSSSKKSQKKRSRANRKGRKTRRH